MSLYTIYSAAEKTGVDAQSIRQYVEMGLIQGLAVEGDMQPLYDELALKRIEFIAHWVKLGTELEQVRPLLRLVKDLSEPSEQIQEMKKQLRSEMDDHKPELEALRRELREIARLR